MDTEGIRLLEEALRKSEADSRLLVDLLESSDQPFAVGYPDGHIGTVNAAFERLTGFNRNELRTMRWAEALTPAEWRGMERAKLEELQRTRQPVRYEKECLRKDGLRIPIELLVHLRKEGEGQSAFYYFFVTDLRKRKRAEEALQRAHDELEACVEERTMELRSALTAREAERQRLINVLDLLPACVVLLSPDYHMRFANRFFRERFGESHGRHCYESLFGRTEPCEGCEHYSVLSTNKPHRWEWTGPDGRNYDTFDFPFGDSDGSVLVLEMGIDITERKRAEEKVHELSGRVLRAQDEERRRIGRELHDGTAQTLAAASLNLATLNRLVDFSTNPEALNLVAEINQLIDQAWQEIRNLAYLLHPPMLEDAGLFAAVRWYVEGFVQRTKINVDLEIEQRPERFSKDVELALFRVLQESLSNVYRHSQSPTARVRLATDSGAITLEVSDQGKGLSASAADGANGGVEGLGVGISGMRERMRQLGGRLEVRSGKVGVTVRAVIPGDPIGDTSKPPEV